MSSAAALEEAALAGGSAWVVTVVEGASGFGGGLPDVVAAVLGCDRAAIKSLKPGATELMY